MGQSDQREIGSCVAPSPSPSVSPERNLWECPVPGAPLVGHVRGGLYPKRQHFISIVLRRQDEVYSSIIFLNHQQPFHAKLIEASSTKSEIPAKELGIVNVEKADKFI